MAVRQLNIKDDIEKILRIERAAWGESAATSEQIQRRSLTFPEGSVVVENDNCEIIGYAASQIVESISTKSWSYQTDSGYITNTHKPTGDIAYGVGMSALPGQTQKEGGVAATIIEYYYNLFIASGRCSILSLGSRLPGYYKWHQKTDGNIYQYLREEFKGLSRDPELRLYQKNGFQLLWGIPDYYPDPESGNYGAMIVRR